MEIDSQKRFGE